MDRELCRFNFPYGRIWQDNFYAIKQEENQNLVMTSVNARFLGLFFTVPYYTRRY